MKGWLAVVLCIGLLACATSSKPPLTEDERLQQKYAGYSTELLQTQRMELAAFIAHGHPQKHELTRLQISETNDPQQQLDEIEQELMRRHAAGDPRAELHPVM